MTVTLVLSAEIATRFSELVKLGVETGGVLLVKPVASDSGDMRLLSRTFHEVPDSSYQVRDVDQLVVSSEGYFHALGRAEAEGAIPVWVHTHPGAGSIPFPSEMDEVVDSQLSSVFRNRAGSDYYGALILGGEKDQFSFSGHLDAGESKHPIDRLLVVGDRISLQWRYQSHATTLSPIFDRNIRAFGGEIQRVLGDLRIGVIGCGGTGSAVAEQLVRLGVRDLFLVDPDSLSGSNLTRVYGSKPSLVGQQKVEVLRDHLHSIAPDLKIGVVPSAITDETVARALASVDLIFGCTDDNAGRLVLSRMATYFLIPLFDCGVVLTSDSSGHLDGIFGRVTTLLPGSACLVCRDRINLAMAATELLTAEERQNLIREGYAPAMPGVEPAVIPFTTAVAAAAVTELVERLTWFGVEPAPTEVILRIHDREISTNRQAPRARHYCHPSSGKLGIGITSPLLEQTWKV